jgi:DNA-binding IclR family transcriptional regulator
MQQDEKDDVRSQNGIPVLERTMEILNVLEMRINGASITDLTRALNAPRTTIYRILNSLHKHRMVRRTPDGAYVLGTKLLSLARRVQGDAVDYNLVELATPFIEQLSETTGQTSKLSVRDGDNVLVLTTVQGNYQYALSAASGQHFPLHAGAASKVLLSYLAVAEIRAILAKPLHAFTKQTIIDTNVLFDELALIRRRGWAEDHGEHYTSVQAIAAPVFNREGDAIAAVSVPFLAPPDPSVMISYRVAIIETANAITGALAHQHPAPP